MKCYKNMGDFLASIQDLPITGEIHSAFIKAWGKIHGYPADENREAFTLYPKIMTSISGGSDSDVMLDLIERIGYPLSEMHYVFFDTGLEFDATKRHLTYLEEKYGIHIDRRKAKIPVPIGIQKYGYPFLNKQVSVWIHRLQLHNFTWEDKPFEELYAQFPRCKAALRWWCNAWGENSRLNISRNKWLKEFMIAHPPDFPISDGCCNGAKKATAHQIEKEINPDLSMQGIRKAEGGARATAHATCFDKVFGGCDQLRPIFWLKAADKRAYEQAFDVTHSDCYSVYGLDRTGCACCPFGKYFERELAAAEKYEPKLFKAANKVFGKSYEYTRMYKEFCKTKENQL